MSLEVGIHLVFEMICWHESADVRHFVSQGCLISLVYQYLCMRNMFKRWCVSDIIISNAAKLQYISETNTGGKYHKLNRAFDVPLVSDDYDQCDFTPFDGSHASIFNVLQQEQCH